MTEQDDYLLLSSDIFGKDHLLSNFLQDSQPVMESSFPSPASSTDSLDSPVMNPNLSSIDPTVLQNLPMSVLQSLAAMYQQTDLNNGLENNSFEQFVKFEEDNSISPSNEIITTTATTPTTTTAINKPKAYRPPRQLECHNCHVTKTPLWRRTPDRAHSLCNACGLYYKQYGTHRPLHVRQKQQTSKQVSPSTTPATTSPISSPVNNLSPACVSADNSHLLRPLVTQDHQCSSCHQSNTPLWRNSENGKSLCNACGIYQQQQQSPLKRRRESEQDGLVIDDRMTKVANMNADTPALFPAAPVLPPSPPSVAVQSKEWAEIDDTRFKTLLSRMNAQQMHGFLGMLERRCSILRSILIPQQE
ncbi:hypothetical protein BDF21DRAFT_418886 [Thamnidium elegans]|uniref:GATA-type domain-containing protein n=1 Tax=Thamnidium elegans TaxID=101142 RepID=A0A8H7SIJ9_9FUNG|nr:hypothetical protein INT48_007267 [Thamnidium elegans]KAI8080364.1 hypothetical protein BDF21DRAFT_418886 [Thamnidium elegans]